MDTTKTDDLKVSGHRRCRIANRDAARHEQTRSAGAKTQEARGARRRRWPKRVAIAFVSLVLLVAARSASPMRTRPTGWDSSITLSVQHLAPPVPPGKPFNVLLVGSDSRKFVDTPGEEKQFGNPTSQTGQRSDVIIIARFVPASKRVLLLSIPRDTYVTIPGNVPNVSGPNRINVAFDTGSPSLLIETIEDVFHIPIQHYVAVNFEGFSDMVNALGGVSLNFSTPLMDTVSDLNVTKTGCQLVEGPEALALVRSRDLQYETPSGWQSDVQGDFSRIRRQDAFFQALLSKANTVEPLHAQQLPDRRPEEPERLGRPALVGQRSVEPGEPVSRDHRQGSHH